MNNTDIASTGNIYAISPTQFYIANEIKNYVAFVSLISGSNTFTVVQYTKQIDTPTAVAHNPLNNTLYTAGNEEKIIYSYPANSQILPVDVTPMTPDEAFDPRFNIIDLIVIVEGEKAYMYIYFVYSEIELGIISKYEINGNNLIFIGTYEFPAVIGGGLSYSNLDGTGTLRIYFSSQPLDPETRTSYVYKLYVTDGGSPIGGDPHIKPLFGQIYDLPNVESCFKLLDNKE